MTSAFAGAARGVSTYQAPPGRLASGSRQQEAIWAALLASDAHLLVEARAGTGKSATAREGMHRLLEVDRSLAGRINYVAFNKSIADEFQAGLPPGARATTMHSAGFAALRAAFPKLGEPNRQKLRGIADRLFPRRDNPSRRAKTMAIRLAECCRSQLIGADAKSQRYGIGPAVFRRLAAEHGIDCRGIEATAFGLVDDILKLALKETASVDFGDMVWLPVMLELDFPPCDVLFTDEAQDLDACQHALVSRMVGDGRMVVVGDSHQCQPAGTMVEMTGGGRRPIEDLSVGDQVVSFNRPSAAMVGRTSQGRKVIGKAVRPFTGMLLSVGCQAGRSDEGDGSRIVTRCTPNHKWVTRFAERNTQTNVVYMMRRRIPGGGHWYRVGWCQLFDAQGNFHLGARARIERADEAWILSVHGSKTGASVEENVVAARFGLPTLPFHPVEGANHITADAIDATFERLAPILPKRAIECLASFGRSIEHPLYTIDRQQRQGRTTIFETQACNLIPGLMMVPVYTGERDPRWTTIDQVDPEFFHELPVYSLQIEDNETYVADGLVTHNSIYGFRGASPQSMATLGETLQKTSRSLERYPLTATRRCPSSHVELAARIVPDFESLPGAPRGRWEEGAKPEDVVEPGWMVLCRKNAPLLSLAFRSVGRGVPVAVQGKDIGEKLARFVDELEGRTVAELLRSVECYRSAELAKLSELDDVAEEIDLVNDRCNCVRAASEGASSPADVSARVRSLFKDIARAEQGSYVLFSSVHRAKGREAERVAILEPESMPSPFARSAAAIEQELNLLYVASSRSKHRLTFLGPIPQPLKG